MTELNKLHWVAIAPLLHSNSAVSYTHLDVYKRQALYKVLTDKSDHEEDLQDFVRLNEEDFAFFYGEDGWLSLIHI